MDKLFSEYKLKGIVVKNRVTMPPMVNFGWADEDGIMTEKHIRHYEARAKGGTGLIIVEACSVNKWSRASHSQPGIWDDAQIDNHKKITDSCKKYGATVLVQIYHGGLRTSPSVTKVALGPSESDTIRSTTRAMSEDEIKKTKLEYIDAAERAYKAGYDGIELHGAHGFLLDQFLSPKINKRTDKYGGSLENRLRFAKEIMEGIRNRIGNISRIGNKSKSGGGFIMGYRLGCTVPTLKDGIEAAIALEKIGVELLHISAGGFPSTQEIPVTPEGYPYGWLVYGAAEIKRHVGIPVIAVGGIVTPERAEDIISKGYADFAAIGRDLLTDPEWANKAMKNEKIRYCYRCKECKKFIGADLCPLIN